MRGAAALLTTLALLPAGCRSAQSVTPTNPPPAPLVTDPFAVVAEADRLAARDLWPDFEPRAIPVAIFDGTRTLLFHHPAPPEGFEPLRGREGVWAYAGRYPSVSANTSVEMGGIWTATLMPATTTASLRTRAGTLIHEKFHVFQRQHHRTWRANEAELFVYPVDDATLLTARRLETEALRRALSSGDDAQRACWARTAMRLRQERFATLPDGAAAYERGTELNEGLATYVERRATGDPDAALLPADDFAPEAVRQRGYRTGVAIARLLDRTSPSWRATLERRDSTALDVLLSTALEARASDAPACTFPAAMHDSVQTVAAADVRVLHTRRAEQRRAFLAQPGWRLVIVAGGDAPLFPQGFDPLNVQRVSSGEVLHSRYLKLGNAVGSIEVLGRASLTEATGAHPLFTGVRTLTVTGLTREPAIADAQGVVTIKADGVSAELRGATVERTGEIVTVHLPVAQRMTR